MCNVNDKLIARIEALDAPVQREDELVLDFIKRRITPEGLAERDPWDEKVDHLHDVANSILRRYERAKVA